MTARNAIVEYLDNTLANLTQNSQYEVISWFNSSGVDVSGLIIDDNGHLYAAHNLQDITTWQVIRI